MLYQISEFNVRILSILFILVVTLNADEQNFILQQSPTITTQDSMQQKQDSIQYINPPKESLSEEEKQELEKGKKSGIEKKDNDLTKLFELLGNSVEHYDNYMVVSGNAILKNKEAYILADEITYNPALKQARLKGNVRIYKGNELSVFTNQATIYLNINYGIIRPFYIQDTKTGIWTTAESASQQRNTYRFADSMVSGCSYVSPAWRINASSGYYKQDSKTLALWNPRIYVGDIPVFYSPYLQFSMINERTSGLLYPTFGTSGTDGFTYIQPYYLALQNFWDMTISPQVRTSKGVGANFEFRAVDSSNDKYLMHFKYFYNFDSYMSNLNALNQHIYGFDFKHSKRNVIQKYFGAKTKIDNGMYFDVAYMNDIDYLRLDDVRYFLNTTHYISRANFYAQTNNHYVGLSLRYYLNLYDATNATTMHNVPNFQYHKYMGNLFIKELLYAFDYQLKNGLRKQGYGYALNEINLPIGFQLPFLNKYFSIGAWLNANAGSIIAMDNDNTLVYNTPTNPTRMGNEDFGNYANLSYRLSLNSDIGRRYNKFFHSLQFNMTFNSPFDRAFFSNGIVRPQVIESFGNLSTSVLERIQNGADIWDPTIFTNLVRGARRLDINMSNYFYSSRGNELFYWRLTQSFNFSDSQSPLKIPMENKIGTSPIAGLNLSASFFYSWFYNNVTELAFSASYMKDSYVASISYYLKRDDALWKFDPVTLAFTSVDATNYLNAAFKGDLGYFGIVGDISYDFRTNNIINLGFGIYKDIKCFGIGIKAGSNRTPILAQGSTINVIDNIYVRAEFKFVPLTTFNYTYRLRPRMEQN
ncbi:LPS-assembly protein LptD [Helicobacter saguini]|nr:LPS-assembly protein LptD [Helicobacter saguini]